MGNRSSIRALGHTGFSHATRACSEHSVAVERYLDAATCVAVDLVVRNFGLRRRVVHKHARLRRSECPNGTHAVPTRYSRALLLHGQQVRSGRAAPTRACGRGGRAVLKHARTHARTRAHTLMHWHY